MYKNVDSQKIAIYAKNWVTEVGKTGDAGNITAQISKDGGATEATNDINPTELDAINHPGVYIFDLTQAETNADLIIISAVSSTDSTEDIVIQPLFIDTVAVSLSPTAVANLEDTYDGTGYTNDNAPSTQEQVGRLTSGSAAINTTAESFEKKGSEPETNTYTSTSEEDGTFHIVEDDGGSTDCYYQFDVGGNGVPVSITWVGYAQSKSDSYAIYAYNYILATYEQIGTVVASNGTTKVTHIYELTNGHVGTGVNLGKVRFKFLSVDGTAFATDRILCSYSIITKSVGYANGAIWVDTNASNTSSEDYVDGVADKPVSTWAAALILNASLGLNRFEIASGSSITLTANSDAYAMFGWEWSLDLGNQSIAGSYINGAAVTGTGTGTGARFFFCKIAQGGTLTVAACGMKDCAIAGNIIASSAATYLLDSCFSGIAGTATPSFDFGAAVANIALNMRHYSGGIEIRNMGATGTDTMSLEGFGQLVLNANCDPSNSPVIAMRGTFTITDNVVGGFVAGGGVLSDDARIDMGQITGVEVDNDGTSISLAGALKLILSVLCGKSSGGGTTTITYRDVNDSKNRVVATVNSNGNRTAIGTRDGS